MLSAWSAARGSKFTACHHPFDQHQTDLQLILQEKSYLTTSLQWLQNWRCIALLSVPFAWGPSVRVKARLIPTYSSHMHGGSR